MLGLSKSLHQHHCKVPPILEVWLGATLKVVLCFDSNCLGVCKIIELNVRFVERHQEYY